MLPLRRSILEISTRRISPRITTQIPLYLSSRKKFSAAPDPGPGSTGKPPGSGSNLSKVFIGSIVLGGAAAAGMTAYQTGYLDKYLMKEKDNNVTTYPVPNVHEESQQSKTIDNELHDVEALKQDAVHNVRESDISSPAIEKGIENDPYYGTKEEETHSEIKELPISESHDTVSDQEDKLPTLDHGISTSDSANIDSIAKLQEDLATKNEQDKPATEQQEGDEVTPLPTEVASVIEENVVHSEEPQKLGTTNTSEGITSDDGKEPNSLLDSYHMRDESEQVTSASSHLDKEVAEVVRGTNDTRMSDDGKLVLDFLQAIHTAEKRQADLDAHIFSEEKRLMKEKYEKELKDARARELMYAERETILDKELHKEKLKAAAALKSLQEKLEEEFRMEIERKESQTELELKKLKDLAKAELTAAIASEKASQIEKLEEANLNINALCMAFYARSEEARQSHSVHKLALGALALEDALSKGLPIQKEIDALHSYLDGIDKDSLLGLVMASLPEDTLKNGTDTILQLNHKFDGLKGTLRHFSLMPPGGGGILAHSLAYIASGLKVKETDKSGDGIESLINRVENFLADGKLLEAAETLEHGLKGSQAAEAVNDWVQQARNRAITEQALTLLQSYATSLSHT
uniref:MICOS complex subunit MIC60 n=1 Tax=Erigeron canadensis TaxID=72917 RepID=UPI001CB98109|nr:MICOS complex subunit MIC60 [Erigeron canadensis]